MVIIHTYLSVIVSENLGWWEDYIVPKNQCDLGLSMNFLNQARGTGLTCPFPENLVGSGQFLSVPGSRMLQHMRNSR